MVRLLYHTYEAMWWVWYSHRTTRMKRWGEYGTVTVPHVWSDVVSMVQSPYHTYEAMGWVWYSHRTTRIEEVNSHVWLKPWRKWQWSISNLRHSNGLLVSYFICRKTLLNKQEIKKYGVEFNIITVFWTLFKNWPIENFRDKTFISSRIDFRFGSG
jgi:hypothetical protein